MECGNVRVINNELLTKYIHQTGLNYKDLAAKLDISRNTIYNVMVGSTCPSAEIIHIFGSSLEFTQDDFVATFYPEIQFKEETLDDELTH